MAKLWTSLALTMWLLLLPLSVSGETPSVLFVGNSYTSANGQNNIAALFEQLAKEGVPGWTDVTTNRVTAGGYTFKKHLADANQPGTKLHTQLVGMPSGTYDYVVLQEQSQTPGFHAANSPLWTDSLDSALALNQLVKSVDANTVFFMTWGRRDGDAQNAGLYPDYLSMQLYLDQGYHFYAQETASSDRITFISPAGRGFQELFENEVADGVDPLDPASLFHMLYSGDGSHPSLLGTYLSAAMLYATLTGRDPTLLSTKPQQMSNLDRDALLALAKKVVVDAPYDHFDSIWGPLPRYPWVSAYQTPPSGLMSVGSSGSRTTVYLDTTAPTIEGVTLGEESDHAGRLGILDGGSLKVTGEITVGLSGNGLLECLGGTLNAGQLVVGISPSSSGSVTIDGGTLDVQDIAGGSGIATLSMHSGQLRARSVGFGWEQAGGTWSLPVDGSNSEVVGNYSLDKEATLRFTMSTPETDVITFGALSVKGSATLRGNIIIDTPGGLNLTQENDVVLMVAESFSTDDLNITLPPGSTWEVVPHQTVLFALKVTFAPTSSSPVFFDPPPGSYDGPIDVTLSTEGDAIIHYTTDGSSVSQNSPSAPSPLVLQLSELGPHTLRAMSVNAFGIASQPSGGSYLLLGPPEVTATPIGGDYDPPLEISLKADRDNCTIYWTLDGSDPSTKAANLYEAPILLDSDGTYTLKARAVAETGLEGPTLAALYQLGSIVEADIEPSEDVVEPEPVEPESADVGIDGASAPVAQPDGGCTGGDTPLASPLLTLLGLSVALTLVRRRRTRESFGIAIDS